MDSLSVTALGMLSAYLNDRADSIKPNDIEEISRECGVSRAEAFDALLMSELGLNSEGSDLERELCGYFFRGISEELSADEWENDPYYRLVNVPDITIGRCALSHGTVKAGEAFVYGELEPDFRGRIKPHIGFFMRDFKYPQITRDGRAWMTITPNEILTSMDAINSARGDCVTFGLGMGYYAFAIAQKENVSRVTVVDIDAEIIELIEKHILPQFPHKEKISIINADAFDYMKNMGSRHDHAFIDIWHDALDGPPLYEKFKAMENLCPDTEFHYWIEKTMKCYM